MLDSKKELVYICSKCGFKAYVRKPAKCPKCKSKKFNRRRERRILTK